MLDKSAWALAASARASTSLVSAVTRAVRSARIISGREVRRQWSGSRCHAATESYSSAPSKQNHHPTDVGRHVSCAAPDRTGINAPGSDDLDVWAALRDNIAGLCDFFDLVVTRERMPLIDYHYSFDMDFVARPLEKLLGAKGLPVTIDHGPYDIVKQSS